jgi:hypothetical protein
MTKPEILQYILKNVPYTRFNDLSMWSEWHSFQSENRAILTEIMDENKHIFLLEIKDNKYRIRKYLQYVKI